MKRKKDDSVNQFRAGYESWCRARVDCLSHKEVKKYGEARLNLGVIDYGIVNNPEEVLINASYESDDSLSDNDMKDEVSDEEDNEEALEDCRKAIKLQVEMEYKRRTLEAARQLIEERRKRESEKHKKSKTLIAAESHSLIDQVKSIIYKQDQDDLIIKRRHSI